MILDKFLEVDNAPPRLLFLTGAGADQPSGIPTFRDSDGMWENFDVEEVCNIQTFVENYEMVHEFYNARRSKLDTVKPNYFHDFIVEQEFIYGPERFAHFTTNVSDLTERIGGSCQHVHGDLRYIIRDWDKGFERSYGKDYGYEVVNTSSYPDELIKPAVVFFGESYRWDSETKRYKSLYDEVSQAIESLRPMDTVFVVGSSDQVLDFSWLLAHKHCHKVLVNPKESQGYFPKTYTTHLPYSCELAVSHMKEIIQNRMFY